VGLNIDPFSGLPFETCARPTYSGIFAGIGFVGVLKNPLSARAGLVHRGSAAGLVLIVGVRSDPLAAGAGGVYRRVAFVFVLVIRVRGDPLAASAGSIYCRNAFRPILVIGVRSNPLTACAGRVNRRLPGVREMDMSFNFALDMGSVLHMAVPNLRRSYLSMRCWSDGKGSRNGYQSSKSDCCLHLPSHLHSHWPLRGEGHSHILLNLEAKTVSGDSQKRQLLCRNASTKSSTMCEDRSIAVWPNVTRCTYPYIHVRRSRSGVIS
jgi:hypothetical protein